MDFVGVLGSKKVGVDTLAGLGSSKHELKRSPLDPMIFLPSLNLGKVAKGFCNAGLK